MAEQVATEEANENARKRRNTESPSTEANRKRFKHDNGNNNNHNQEDGGELNIWEEWKAFLNNEENTRHLMQLR